MTAIYITMLAVATTLISVTYYSMSRKHARPLISILVALGFTALTPFIFIVASVAILLKFAQLLINEINKPTV